VLDTLEPLPGDRKCFRMINGVLTERTVKEVVPILQTNSEGLKKALEELVKQYKSKQDEMEKWKVCITSLLSPHKPKALLVGIQNTNQRY
jgi:prefoldin subunit 2